MFCLNCNSEIDTSFRKNRRRLVLAAFSALATLAAAPVLAFDIFKLIDPKGENKDLQKSKKLLEGFGSIAASSTDLDYRSEMAIGESLALEGFRRYGLSVKDAKLQKYVNLVGNSLGRNSERPEIPYYFVVVASPLYNAFACPGGIIFLSSTLMKHVRDESQLAGVLAHEVAHVSHKHALKTIKQAKFFEGVGKISEATMGGEEGQNFRDMIGSLETTLFEKGLDKNMEFEADSSGMEIAYRTGYNPEGLKKVLQMLQTKEKSANKAGSWFGTHPPLSARIASCRQKMKSFPDAAAMASVKKRFQSHAKRL